MKELSDLKSLIDKLGYDLDAVSVSDFRSKLPTHVNECKTFGKQLILKNYKEPVAALVPIMDLVRLRELEERKIEKYSFSDDEDLIQEQDSLAVPDFLRTLPDTDPPRVKQELEEEGLVFYLTQTINRLNEENERLAEELKRQSSGYIDEKSERNGVGRLFYNEIEWALQKELAQQRDEGTARELITMLDKLGLFNLEKQNYDRAIRFFNEAMRAEAAYFGAHSPMLGALFSNAGTCRLAIGEYDEAIEYFRRALMIELSNKRDVTSALAESIDKLSFEKLEEDLDVLISYCKHDLFRDAKCYGTPRIPYNVSKLSMCLGNRCIKQGNLEKAISYFERALSIAVDAHGDSNPIVVDCVAALSSVWLAYGDKGRATECLMFSICVKQGYSWELTPYSPYIVRLCGIWRENYLHSSEVGAPSS